MVVIGILSANLVFKENLSPLLIALSITPRNKRLHIIVLITEDYLPQHQFFYHIISVQRNLN